MHTQAHLIIFFKSDLAAAECRASALDHEHSAIMSRATEAESFLAKVRADLQKETACRKQETELLAQKVNIKTTEKTDIYQILTF